MAIKEPATVDVDRHTEPATLAVRATLLTIVVFFGGSLPAYKLASESFGPATTNLVRFVLAATMLMIVARRRLPSAREHIRRLIVIGMFGIGLMAVFMGIGVDRGSATIGSIVVGLEPIGVALAGVLLVGDAPSRRSLVALVIGFTGALVASGVFTEHSGPSPVVPIILLLGTVVAFSIYTAFVRRVGRGVDPLAIAAVTQVGALIFVIPACLFDVFNGGMLRGHSVTPKALGAVIFLGIGSGIAYLLLCFVLKNQPSNRVAVTMFLTPMFGVLFSWLVVGEHLHLRDGVGAALVLLAVWISERAVGARRSRTLVP
ncbi:MAG: DMT family transporter [Ilumatobacteraceae bacterium]